MGSKNPLLRTLISMTGQNNVITVHRPFVEFTGTLEAAMMLSQLLYWTPRSTMEDGWIAKSDQDWKNELCLARYSSRSATKTLIDMGLIETKIKKFRGAPTTHYRVIWEKLEMAWIAWLDCLESDNGSSDFRQSDYPKSDDEMSENGQSLTETTSETTQENTSEIDFLPDFKNMTVKDAHKLWTLKLYSDATDFFPGSPIWEPVHKAIVEHNLDFQKIQAASQAWVMRGFKQSNVRGILDWAINGIPEQYKNSRGGNSVPNEPKGFDAVRKFLGKEEARNGQ